MDLEILVLNSGNGPRFFSAEIIKNSEGKLELKTNYNNGIDINYDNLETKSIYRLLDKPEDFEKFFLNRGCEKIIIKLFKQFYQNFYVIEYSVLK